VEQRLSTLRAPAVAAAILGALFSLLACQPAPAPSPAANILVVVLDACRPDRMGCYGYDRETTPAIDALAADPDTVLFRRHYVQGAWTKASTASLFTGLFAFQHGVLRGDVMEETEDRPGVFLTSVLDARFDTMAERLGGLGYHTFAVVKSRHLTPALGFAQGFEDYHSPEEVHDDGQRVAKVLELAGAARRPFFGYLHVSGCHHPFPESRRHPAVMERYGAEPAYDEKARQAAGVDFTDSEIKHRILDGEVRLEPEDVGFLGLVYDAELRQVDENQVLALVAGLRERGLYDDTLVVLTADHGEELYEHGGYAHGHALWDEVVHVPLLVKFPRGRRPAALGREVSAVTQSVDLLPSLLAFSGAPPAPELPGADIFGGGPRGFAFSQTKDRWALVQDGHKLIDDGTDARLFDLEADPGERQDLALARPERVAAMRLAVDALRQHVAIGPADAPAVETQLDPEAVEALRGLGYVR
jgi:arylsulfatase A-like enzyme